MGGRNALRSTSANSASAWCYENFPTEIFVARTTHHTDRTGGRAQARAHVRTCARTHALAIAHRSRALAGAGAIALRSRGRTHALAIYCGRAHVRDRLCPRPEIARGRTRSPTHVRSRAPARDRWYSHRSRVLFARIVPQKFLEFTRPYRSRAYAIAIHAGAILRTPYSVLAKIASPFCKNRAKIFYRSRRRGRTRSMYIACA